MAPIAPKKNLVLSKKTYHDLSKGLLSDEKSALKRIYIRSLRRSQQRGPPIFFDHRIDARTMRGILIRLKKKRDVKLLDEKSKKLPLSSSQRLFKKITSREIATRIISKELISGLKGLTPEQNSTLLRLITSRDKHRFPGTKIRVEPDRRYLLLKLVNELGPQKTKEIVKTIIQRTADLHKEANKVSHGGRLGDSFININQVVDAQFNHHLSGIMESTQTAVQEGFAAMKQETAHLKQLEETNLPTEEKERIRKILNARTKAIREEIHKSTSPKHFIRTTA